MDHSDRLCRLIAGLLLLSGAFLLPAQTAAALDSEAVAHFEKKIRPLLISHCHECHSAESKKAKGGLLVDTREGLLKGGDSGPAIVPGDPDKSLLIRAVQYADEDLQMPPQHRLSADQVADLVAWVKMGAPDPRQPSPAAAEPARSAMDLDAARSFWAFQALKETPPPATRNRSWPESIIDHYVLAKLEEKGLAPAPDADRRALIRRATFDLIGLPPTPDEIDAFLADISPDAFEKVVDRLLASPHYGERWGRHWLDVIRYADSAGDSSDYPIPQAYKFRNYVIDSFNRDKPYDQFIREQIAGDLLPSAGQAEKHERIIATGYLALARRFSVNPESVQHLTIEDTIDNLGKAFLGLTVSCARCHDHKYDPISTEDYYALYGIFSSTQYPFAGSENEKRQRGLVALVEAEKLEEILKPFKEKLAPVEAEIKKLEQELAEIRRATQASTQSGESDEKTIPGMRPATEVREELRQARRRRDVLSGQAPPVERAFAVSEGAPRNARVHIRGEPGKQGAEVPRRFLQVLGGYSLPPEEKGSGRLQLADWIANPKNPLTARVMANRIWQHHFGKGLVQTPSDFGVRGKPPTHPELLDYLASQFIQGGWSIKQMHKKIMLSRTYRQSSRHDERHATIDPNNDWLWKFDRRRLDAESIRDAMLFVSGGLDGSMVGQHPFPSGDKWTFTQHAPFNAVYDSNLRSVYLMQQRIKKHPYLELFDGADPNSSTATRLVNTTPLQALFLMNDKFAHEQATRLARRLVASAEARPARIDLAYRLAYGRPPAPEEASEIGAHLESYARRLAALDVAPSEREIKAWASVVRVLLSSNEFVFVD